MKVDLLVYINRKINNVGRFVFRCLDICKKTVCTFPINDDIVLQFCMSVKLLGIIIDTRLSFSEHIGHICKKAGSKINALARISIYLDAKAKLVLFKYFMLCHFNLCPWYATFVIIMI